jgi:UDP-N-acetylmuramate dehydrogenase
MTHSLPEELLKLPHRREVPFAKLTTLGLGGLCHWLFEPGTEEEAQSFVRICHRADIPYRVLGGGSNLVVLSDVHEPVLRLRLASKPERKGNFLWAPASQGHIALSETAADMGLSGLEWACGIPGSLGGAIRMNAGAQGHEWLQVLSRYTLLTPAGERIDKAPEPGEFGYRWSCIRDGRILLSATAQLAEGDSVRIRETMKAHREKRRQSQPLQERSAGCIFKNPSGHHAGRLIEEAGLKGFCVGDAMVSPIHANFLLNLGTATASEFQDLMTHVRERVKEIHGIGLEFEVEIWK